MSLEFHAESRVLYIRVRGSKVVEIMELAEREFGAYLDVDREGNVVGVEFLSLKEFAELISRFGRILELPHRIEVPPSFA